jgi:catechol 2,3-dioxygenase-like lactoylglutathione lyase family enzyme
MGFHHTAFATRDLQGTHRFYTEVMGFDLVKTIVAPTEAGGWAKHVFYQMGKEAYIAFWDLHDDTIGDKWSPAISTGQGLPIWVNHLAFQASSLADLGARRERWLEHGHDVMEIDHEWCQSIYTVDPNGILVEFCVNTREMTAADREEAHRLLADPHPPLAAPPAVTVHRAKQKQAAVAAAV